MHLFSGVGRNNVRYIASDEKGRIKVDSFVLQVEEDIKNGLTPFYLNATAGTTVLGAFDAINELSVICKNITFGFMLMVRLEEQ